MLPLTYTSNSFNFPRRMLLHSPFLHHKQATPPPPSDQLYPSSSSNHRSSFDANVVMIFSVLLCLLIFSICVNCLIRCILKCIVMVTQERNSNIHQKEVVSCGVDKRALKTFPVVKYSKEVKIQGLSTECVICLSDFKGGEKIRILPKCTHGFHVKCIDKWLSSHSSCPTCRQSLVDTCQKIIDYDHHHHEATTSSSSSSSSEVIAISIVPLEREDVIIRN